MKYIKFAFEPKCDKKMLLVVNTFLDFGWKIVDIERSKINAECFSLKVGWHGESPVEIPKQFSHLHVSSE